MSKKDMTTRINNTIHEAKPAPEYLKLSSAAALIDVSVDTLRRMIRNGELTGYRNSRNPNAAVFVRRDELMNVLAPIPTVGTMA